MGRRSKQTRKIKTRDRQQKKAVQAKSSGKYTVDELLDRVEEYIDTFQYELAQKFCQRALEMDADNLRVLETSGTLLLELGEMEKAKHCFGRAIELSPDQGYSKYMYMGQLMTGEHAIQCFFKGIELMKKYIVHMESEKTQTAGACAMVDEVSNKDVSSAYCSIAEIYLTDECFKDSADEQCKECLENAIKEDAHNAEAHHLYASYWLSKQQAQKAQECIKKGLSLWLPQWRDVCEKSEGEAIDPLESCVLSYPARINVTKILVELEDYNTASEILELLLDEDDEIVETWYLLGWINYLQGDEFKQNARYYLGKSQKIAVKTKCEDEEIIKHTEELLAELGGPVDEDPEDTVENGEETHIASDSEDEEHQQNNMDVS